MDEDELQEHRRARLKDLVAAYDENEAALGADLGFKSGHFIGQMLEGRRSITEKTVRKIEALPGKAGWFSHASGAVLRAIPTAGKRRGEEVTIRQFDAGGSMGTGVVLRDQPGVIQSWRVSHEWIVKNVRNYSSTENLCIVTGFGDSMRPMFNPGDPLLVDRGVNEVEYDAVYFFRVGEEGFIKRLQRIPGQGIVAISENKAYREWSVDKADMEVFGRVLKVWRGEDF